MFFAFFKSLFYWLLVTQRVGVSCANIIKNIVESMIHEH